MPNKQNISFSGFLAYVYSIMALNVALLFKVPVTIVYDKFIPLMTSAILFSFIMSVFLYFKARHGPDSQKAPLGNTGEEIFFKQNIWIHYEKNHIQHSEKF